MVALRCIITFKIYITGVSYAVFVGIFEGVSSNLLTLCQTIIIAINKNYILGDKIYFQK